MLCGIQNLSNHHVLMILLGTALGTSILSTAINIHFEINTTPGWFILDTGF